MIKFIKRRLEKRRREAERKRKWNEDYAKLSPMQKDVVRRLLEAQIRAADIMNGY